MSFIYKSLNGLDPIGAGDLQNSFRLTVLTDTGMGNLSWGTMAEVIRAPLESRLTALETAGPGAPQPSIWPAQRTLTLAGLVTGSVGIDGSQNVTINTVIADGALPVAKVAGLAGTLDTLQQRVNGTWTTGYTGGPSPSSYGGDLNLLTGAVFVHTEAGTSHLPPAGAGGNFTILHNGPMNFGQQMGLRNGELWLRGQHMGTWTDWAKSLTTRDLDLSTLLLKTDTATAATKLATARAVRVQGVVSSSPVNFDGTSALTLTTTMDDGALTLAKVNGLSAALAAKWGVQAALGTESLNTIQTLGQYIQSTAANATTARLYPVANSTGVLAVYGEGSLIVQTYTTSDNGQWRRTYKGSSWSAWTRQYGTLDFDPTTKFDKVGGDISGAVTMASTLGVSGVVTAPSVTLTALGAAGSPQWLVRAPRAHAHTTGLRSTDTAIELVNAASNGALHALGITEAGDLNFRGQKVFYGGNFDPAAPVPTSGVLTVGASNGTRLLLRNDGRYSTDGGSTWRELNEAPQAITNPRFATVAIGADNDLLLYEQTAGTLSVRSGSDAGYRYFNFNGNGNFEVLNGRVLIGAGGHEAWHAGNFTPTSKLDTTATAAAATKLATARTINGVAFDGTQNITLPGSLNPDDYVRVAQTAPVSVNPETLGGKLAQTIVASDPAGAPGPYVTVWNFGTSGGRDGQIAWSFGPSSEFYMRGRYDQTGGWKAWSRVWTDQTFNPASKLNYRASLDTSAQSITDWNNAANNGWYMASGAQNAPPGFTASGEWLIGTVSQHNPDWIQQEVWAFTGSTSRARWRRYKTAGSWGPWTRNREFGEVAAEFTTGMSVSAMTVRLPYGQQSGALAYYWNGARIWQQGVESNGDWKLWSYDTAGNYQGNPLTIQGSGSMGIMMEAVNEPTSRFSVNGGIKSYGGAATISLKERDGNDGPEWSQYAAGGVWRLWRSGIGDVVTVNTAGGLSASRIAAGWDSGHGGSISCSNWFRTTGQTGIFFADYGGGVYMEDSTYVRAYNGKAMAANWFETTGGHNPAISAHACGFRTHGAYGGGYGMTDGASHITMFSIGGTLTFGFGTNGIQAHPAQITAGGVYLGADFMINSDKSLKENIQPLHYRGRLNPVTYDYIDGLKFRMGFLADEVEELYPEAVGRDPVTGKRRLSESMLTSVLAAQANAQGDEIEALQDTVSVLENTVVTLRQELAEIKRLVANLRSQ